MSGVESSQLEISVIGLETYTINRSTCNG